MRPLLILLVAVTAIAATGCPNNTEVDGPVEYHVSLTEPAAGDSALLADGESIDTEISESRDALLLVLNGIPAPPADQPINFGLVKAVEAEIYIDVDDQDGPEQWITVAEVQDDDGNVLWFDRVNSIFQLLEYLELVLDQQSAINFGVPQVFGFVAMQYPQLLEFGVRVPLGIVGGTQYVLKLPREDGTLYEAYRAQIDELVAAAAPPSDIGEVKTILENGDPADQLDIVILGDGYTADQQERFELDAQAIADRLVKAEPFATKSADLNIHTVWLPSVEEGAGYDCTGIPSVDLFNGCKNDLRDTVFETTFVLSALADRFQLDLMDASTRVAMPLQVGRLFEVAANVPFDEIIMVSNTRRTSGFAGLYISVLTANDGRIGFPDTAVHEFGHAFGVLGDEYNVEGDPCLFNEPFIPLPPNISTTAELDELKWSHLVADGTPLPTSPGEGDVGAFLGTYNCDELYRPSHTCKMRNSDDDFCPVCSEQLVSRMFAYVDPLAREGKATAKRDGAELVFTVPVRRDDVTADWFIGETLVGEGAELRLGAADVPTEWSQLRAHVRDGTGFVVGDKPRTAQNLHWWVRR